MSKVVKILLLAKIYLFEAHKMYMNQKMKCFDNSFFLLVRFAYMNHKYQKKSKKDSNQYDR